MADIKSAILQAVSQALESMGIAGGGIDDDPYGEGAGDTDNNMTTLANISAGTLGKSPGITADKSSLMAPQQPDQSAQVDAYGMPMAGDQEELMSALGIV